MIYGYIFAFFGALATCASMAEMASMSVKSHENYVGHRLICLQRYPISGGQYHWTALLAPRHHAKFLSWLTGWLSTLGWYVNLSTYFLFGALVDKYERHHKGKLLHRQEHTLVGPSFSPCSF